MVGIPDNYLREENVRAIYEEGEAIGAGVHKTIYSNNNLPEVVLKTYKEKERNPTDFEKAVKKLHQIPFEVKPPTVLKEFNFLQNYNSKNKAILQSRADTLLEHTMPEREEQCLEDLIELLDNSVERGVIINDLKTENFGYIEGNLKMIDVVDPEAVKVYPIDYVEGDHDINAQNWCEELCKPSESSESLQNLEYLTSEFYQDVREMYERFSSDVWKSVPSLNTDDIFYFLGETSRNLDQEIMTEEGIEGALQF